MSISFALALTHLGSKGETNEEMKEVMHFADVADEFLHPTFSNIQKALLNPEAKYHLHMANRLFGEKSYEFLESYLGDSMKHYSAEMAAVDFV
jgi:serpin B